MVNWDSNQNDAQIEAHVKGLFARVRALPVAPEHRDPYLKTRVLAELRGRSHASHAPKFSLWKTLALASSALSMSLAVWIVANHSFQSASHVYQASLNQAVVVRVEIADLSRLQIARAAIELPEGVHFYSTAHPELAAERNLSVAWEGGLQQTKFPFVIKSEASGKKTVRVNFFDANDKLVATRDVEIKFL